MPRPVSPEQRQEWANRVRLQNESGQNLSKWCAALRLLERMGILDVYDVQEKSEKKKRQGAYHTLPLQHT